MRLPRDAVAGMPVDLVVQAPAIAREDLALLAALTDAEGVLPLSGTATEAYRLHDIRGDDGIAEASAAAGYDWALVPLSRRRDRVRLLAMDMDSTLITIECIDEIADVAGIKPEVAAITASAMRGEIDFRASLSRRVALLAGLPVAALETVYSDRLTLSPGATTLLDAFSKVGAKTLLVSGGFTFFTERLKSRLGIDYVLANELEITDGKLTGRVIGDVVDAAAKARTFRQWAQTLRGDDGLTLAIGDGANDVPMLDEADVSVAYRAKPIVRARATHAIDHCGLDAVLNLFA